MKNGSYGCINRHSLLFRHTNITLSIKLIKQLSLCSIPRTLWYLTVKIQWSAIISTQWRRFFLHQYCFDLWQFFFQMTNLQEKKDKLLIDNFSLFPCFWFLKAWWNTKLEFKVVFIVLIFTKDIWKKFIKLWSNFLQLLEILRNSKF